MNLIYESEVLFHVVMFGYAATETCVGIICHPIFKGT